MTPCNCQVGYTGTETPPHGYHFRLDYCPLHKAAPGLLEALRVLADAYDAVLLSEFETHNNPNPGAHDPDLIAARAAIAKAEGK